MSRSLFVQLLVATSFVATSLVAVGCGDDTDEPGDTSSDTADAANDTATDTTADVATDVAADAPADTAADTPADTTADTGTDSSTDTPTDAVADTSADTTEDATADTTADTAAPRLTSNGCSYATATDMRDTATVDVSGIAAWMVSHQVCIIVSAGTTVTWSGNFTAHPLTGGVTGTTDPTSPITVAGGAVVGGIATATLSEPGDYPYFCSIHQSLMQGVIYVD